MTIARRASLPALVIAAIVAAVALAPTLGAAQAPALFSSTDTVIDVDRAGVGIPQGRDVRYLRQRLVSVDTDRLATVAVGQELRFNFFDDVDLTIVVDDVIAGPPGERSIVGHVRGYPLSNAIFERIDEVMVGRVAIPGAAYGVRFAGNGLHWLQDINRAAFARPDRPIDVPGAPATVAVAGNTAAGARSTFRVLTVYKQLALAAEGSKKALKAAAKLTFTWWNAAAKAQKVKHVTKPAGFKKIKGVDSGDLTTELLGTSDPTTPAGAQALSIRNKKNADFVQQIVAGDGSGFGFCGLAFRPFAISAGNSEIMFSATRGDCNRGSGGQVGAHETLHNMSGCHAAAMGVGPCTNPATKYAFGKVVTNANVRRVDAHTTLGTAAVCQFCQDLLTFSGKKKFKKNKVGNNKANIAKLVNDGAKIHEAYR